MFVFIKKLLFFGTFNFCLFLILIIGIQNSSIKRKVNLIKWQTIPLPISFIWSKFNKWFHNGKPLYI